MTTKPDTRQLGAGKMIRFPDAPPEEMAAYHHVNVPGYPGSIALHFGSPETTVILSEIAAGLFVREGREGIRYPDLLVSFNARPELIIPRNGYLIPEQGKPPDFVLEVASASTGETDEDDKHRDYARFRVPEYWRFDPSGGEWHSVPLAGHRLVGDEYRSIRIHHTPEGNYRGRSEALNLDLCWEGGQLRWYDPVAQRYLPDFWEKDAQHRAAETRADAEAARVLQLEEELRRLRGE